MLNIKFNTPGCFAGILFLLLLAFLFKFWLVILFAIGVLIIFSKLKGFFKTDSIKKEFVSKPGRVYKECPYCMTKADRSATSCDACGKSFE